MHALRLLWSAHNEEVWQRRQDRDIRRKSLESIRGMPDALFTEHFRLDKHTFRWLCNELRRKTSLRGTRAIPLEVKVLCALSFLATGSYQRIVGVTQHLTQRTASRCIREFVNAMNEDVIVKQWIRFPETPAERAHIKQEFQRLFHLPGVIGCIDCTHIAIVRPADHEEVFFNRKGFHSLNVQVICDHNLRILGVNHKFGGATHDSYIWASSHVEQYMRGLHQNRMEYVWLLGDSGYPQRPWLMTPVLNAAPGSREEQYTNRHVQARNCIERCFGLLKSRWRCLLKDRTLHYHPLVASKITMACCVLHNIALNARLPPPNNVAIVDDGHVDFGPIASTSSEGSQSELVQGRAMLTSLISRM